MKTIRACIFPVLFFLMLRILFLTSLPIVNDESMYLHWGNDFITFWSNPSMPLSLQGKQALTALTLGIAQTMPIDPLVAGRLASIVCSLIGLWAFIRVATKVLHNTYAVFATLLLSSSPLLLFFDRLALPDSIVAASYMCALYLWLLLTEKPTLKMSILLGITIAIGWWYKSTALLIIPSIILSSIVYMVHNHKHNLTRYILYTCVSLLTAFTGSLALMYTIFSNRIVPLSQTGHVFTLTQLLTIPWSIWLRNVGITLQMLCVFSSPFAFLFGILFLFKKKLTITQCIIFVWAIVPIMIEIFLAHIYNSRYMIIAIAPSILVFAIGLERIKQWKRTSQLIALSTSIILSVLLIAQPLTFYRITAVLPQVHRDLTQYVAGWSSGWGVQEASHFLQKEIGLRPAIIFVRNDSGNPEDGMYVYFSKTKHIKVLPITYINQVIASTPRGTEIASYFVSRGNQLAGIESRLTELVRFTKPLDTEYVGIYKLKMQ